MTYSDDNNVDINTIKYASFDELVELWLKIMQIDVRSSMPIQQLCMAIHAKSLPTHVLEYLASSFTDLT